MLRHPLYLPQLDVHHAHQVSSSVLGTHSVSNYLQFSEPWLAALNAPERGECLGAVWHSRALTRSARHTVSHLQMMFSDQGLPKNALHATFYFTLVVPLDRTQQ